MEHNYFKDNLIFRLKRNNKRPFDIAKDLKISQTSVYKWVRGERIPRYDSLKKLAEYFNCNVSDLTDKPAEPSTQTIGVKIPVLGSVQAGIPIDAIQEVLDYEEISKDIAKTGEFFALQIKGDSMEPQMSHGDIVIIRKQDTIESGQIGIVIVNGNDGTIKKVIITKTGIELHSFNEKYQPIKYDTEDIMNLPVKIVGRVIECRKKY